MVLTERIPQAGRADSAIVSEHYDSSPPPGQPVDSQSIICTDTSQVPAKGRLPLRTRSAS